MAGALAVEVRCSQLVILFRSAVFHLALCAFGTDHGTINLCNFHG